MNDLDSLFKVAKKLKDKNPPDDFVLSILDSQSEKVNYFKKYRRTIIMTAILSIISIISLFILGRNDDVSVITQLQRKNVTTDSISTKLKQDIKSSTQIKKENAPIRNTTNYYGQKTNEKEESTEFKIIKNDKNFDLINPNSIDTDPEGYPIPGLLTPKLNKEELKKLSILLDDNEIQWKMENYFQIHPIPFRNNPNYWKNTEIEDFINYSYPVNGDTLLIKNNLKINLDLEENLDLLKNYGQQSRMIFGRNDSIRKNVFGKIAKEIIMMQYYSLDTINGKEQFTLNEKIISAPDSSLLFMDKNEYFKISQKYLYQGFTSIPQKYNGWRKQNYDLSLPLITAIKYRKSGRIKEIRYRDSPIYSFINYKVDYSKLIPITINFDNKIIERIVFWFYPTEEFISKLPQRYKNLLSKEVNLVLNQNNDDKINCSEIDPESFLDYCRSRNSQLLFSSINPNPAIDIVNLKFEVFGKITLQINLHNSEGKFIGNLSKEQEYQKGVHEVKIDLSNLKNGLYLISIKNTRNEFVSKRLIINR